MNLGSISILVAAILFFLAAVGSYIIPNAVNWGLFALALGLLLGGKSLSIK